MHINRLPAYSLVLWGVAACQSTPPPSAAETKAPVVQSAAARVEAEGLDITTLTVNGKPRQELTTKRLLAQLGRPDSIAKGVVECGSDLAGLNKLDGAVGDAWYYGKTWYEVSGTQALLASFEVTTGKFSAKLGPLTLNQGTTLEDVRRYFPAATKQAAVPATHLSREVISLPFYHRGVPTDASLELLFRKGQLQEVTFFSPC